MLDHKSEAWPCHSTMQTFTMPCIPHPVRWCWRNLNGRNPEFSNHWAWRWSQAINTSFPDSPSNDFSLKASKTRNQFCHDYQWACFPFLRCRIVAAQSCEAAPSATGSWEDVVSTWITCSSEERSRRGRKGRYRVCKSFSHTIPVRDMKERVQDIKLVTLSMLPW